MQKTFLFFKKKGLQAYKMYIFIKQYQQILVQNSRKSQIAKNTYAFTSSKI